MSIFSCSWCSIVDLACPDQVATKRAEGDSHTDAGRCIRRRTLIKRRHKCHHEGKSLQRDMKASHNQVRLFFSVPLETLPLPSAACSAFVYLIVLHLFAECVFAELIFFGHFVSVFFICSVPCGFRPGGPTNKLHRRHVISSVRSSARCSDIVPTCSAHTPQLTESFSHAYPSLKLH